GSGSKNPGKNQSNRRKDNARPRPLALYFLPLGNHRLSHSSGGTGMSGLTRPRTWAVALCAGLLTLTVTIALSAPAARQAAPAQGIITGVVQGENGPEAGVWVIAETKDLPTNFIKIVVT